MYHDQGLPVIKHVGFGNAVNVTLGTADPAHQRRPRHRAQPGANRQGGHRQPARGSGACHRASASARRVATCRFVSASASIFCMIPRVIRRIVDAVAPASGERVVEIGPGRGALTWRPARARRAAWTSSRSTATWRERCEADPRAQGGLRVHVENVLRHRLRAAARRRAAPLRIVGNLPYNISTPLLFRLLSAARRDRRHAFHAAEGSRGPHGARSRGTRTTAA